MGNLQVAMAKRLALLKAINMETVSSSYDIRDVDMMFEFNKHINR